MCEIQINAARESNAFLYLIESILSFLVKDDQVMFSFGTMEKLIPWFIWNNIEALI